MNSRLAKASPGAPLPRYLQIARPPHVMQSHLEDDSYVILMGDFNEAEGSPGVQKLSEVLNDSHNMMSSDYKHVTYNAWEDYFQDHERIDYVFFKHMMSTIEAVGGFDKELELKLLRDREKIEYLHNALVYDEKVQKATVFANQRKRWLSAQFIYFRRFFFSGLRELFLRGFWPAFNRGR